MNLKQVIEGKEYIIEKVNTQDEEMDNFLFSLGCYKGEPIGFICWDPRNRPEYVEIGHNGIRTKYKGKGFGKAQLSEAVRRIKEYEGLKEIRVGTNSNLRNLISILSA